ncbi:restriction endonuclease [Halobacillus amylolyticus]|uniref:Restriction endonuclease n=1 Tax=Halobacillus amylolyticus TaxID=2932259 RepID=A0ABY4HGP9_9BACI|nr:restriction endonuclease [Halobacillus amylolyticus]
MREVFVREGYETHWTGKGPDGGRDLIVHEKVQGPLSKFERKWLVQCKHKSHSGKPLGKDEANSLTTDCRRIGATGYLMVCTTALTSGLINAYKELESSENIVIDYWDEVRLEDRLLKPGNFALINQFFPESSDRVSWKVYNTNTPSFWAAHYKKDFLYLSSRLSLHFPTVSYIGRIYDYVQDVYNQLRLDVNEVDLQIRGIFYNDKHTEYTVFVDFIADQHIANANPFELTNQEENLVNDINAHLCNFIEVNEKGQIGSIPLNWDIKVYFKNRSSDGYDRHAKEFYTPFIDNLKNGYRR